jgi:hypothetical protein
MAKGNDLVLPAMEDENGAMDHRKILECTILIGHKEFHENSGQAVPGGFPQRRKTGFEDEHLRFMNLAHPGRDGTPQRSAEDDDLLRILLSNPGKVIPSGLCIPVGSLLRGVAAASSIPSIVKNEEAQPETVEDPDGIQAVGDVSSIAVTE